MLHAPKRSIHLTRTGKPAGLLACLISFVHQIGTHRRALRLMAAIALMIAAAGSGHYATRVHPRPPELFRCPSRATNSTGSAGALADTPRSPGAAHDSTPRSAAGDRARFDPRHLPLDDADSGPGRDAGAEGRGFGSDPASSGSSATRLLARWRALEPDAPASPRFAQDATPSGTGGAIAPEAAVAPPESAAAEATAAPSPQAGAAPSAPELDSTAVAELLREIHLLPATPEAVAALRELLAHSGIPAVRLAALRRLESAEGGLDAPSLAEVVRTSALSGPDSALGAAAWRALQGSSDPAAADLAARLVAQETAPDRKAALELLSGGTR